MSFDCYEPKCECQLYPKFMKKFRLSIIDYMQQRCNVKKPYIKTMNVPICEICKQSFNEIPEKRAFSKFQS